MIDYKFNLKYNNEQKIGNRKAIFLDTNIWIDIVENQAPIVVDTKNKLIDLTKSKKIFCPLNLFTNTELLRQHYSSLKVIAKIVDKLSLNLSFEMYYVVYEIEVENFFKNKFNQEQIQIHRDNLFVPYACVGKKDTTLQLPDTLDKSKSRNIIEIYNEKVVNLKFSEYVNFMKDELPQKVHTDSNLFIKEWIERKKNTNNNKEKMYVTEEDWFIQNDILPLIMSILKKLGIKALLNSDNTMLEKMTAYLLEIQKENLPIKGVAIAKEIIGKCPLLKNSVEVVTFAGFDTQRKGRESDLVDLEVMIASSSYYDSLFTKDKWIFDTLKRNKKRLISNTDFFNDYKSFNLYLDSL